MIPKTDGNIKEPTNLSGVSFLSKKDFLTSNKNNVNNVSPNMKDSKIPQNNEYGQIANHVFEPNHDTNKQNYYNIHNNNEDNSFNEFKILQQTNSGKEGFTITSQPSTERQNMLQSKDPVLDSNQKDPVLDSNQKDQLKGDNIKTLKSEENIADFTNIQMNSLSQINIPGSTPFNKSMSYTKLKQLKERGDFKDGILPVISHQNIDQSYKGSNQFQEHNSGFQRRNTVIGNNGRHNTIENKFILGSGLKKTKGLASVLPMIFSGIKTFKNSATYNTEKNLENNIRTMVKFVKLKQKVAEIKRYFLKETLLKSLVNSQGSIFSRVLDDATSKPIEQEQFPEKLWIYNYICGWKFLTKIKIFFKRIPTIEPSSKWKIVWDLLIGIVLIAYFFFIPIHIAINVPIHQLVTTQLGYSLHCLMFLDIFFSMNTGFFEKGVNVQSKTKILLYYVKNYFWGDMISQIPLLVSELGSQDSQIEKVFVMFFLVKLRNFSKIFRKFEESFHLSPRAQNVISLVKLILTILFFSHIFSCIWVFVGKQQDNSTTTWLDKINMSDSDWVQQYIAAYYFSTVTMITVGYGDIVPMNNTERLISIGTMLVSCVIFAYTINQIGTIFSDLLQQDRQMKEYFNIINDYMDNKNIGFSLQYKIREYLDYYWREQDSNKSELEKKVIDSLSDQLREKLMIEANRIVFQDSGIFSNNFNQAVILKMIPIIQTLHTTPNQTIFSEGQIDEEMFIYFIEKGKVEICREMNLSETTKVSKSIITLGPGESFGAHGFVTNMPRLEMVRSLEFSKLLMIRRSDFLELISENPQDLEKFNHLKDRIVFENNLRFLDVKCQACQSVYHPVQHCHYFHYQPDKYVIIRRKNIEFKEQDRDKFFKRKRLICSFRQFDNHVEIIEQCKKWRDEQKDLNEQYITSYLSQKIDFLYDVDEDDFQGRPSGEFQDLENYEVESSQQSSYDSVEEEDSDEYYSQSSQSYSSDNNNSNSNRRSQSRRKNMSKKQHQQSNGAIEEEEENDLTASHIKMSKLRSRQSTLSKYKSEGSEEDNNNDKKNEIFLEQQQQQQQQQSQEILSKSQLPSSDLDDSSESDINMKKKNKSKKKISISVPNDKLQQQPQTLSQIKIQQSITQIQLQRAQNSLIQETSERSGERNPTDVISQLINKSYLQTQLQLKNNNNIADTIKPIKKRTSIIPENILDDVKFQRDNMHRSTQSPKTPQDGSMDLSQRRGGEYKRLTIDTINSNNRIDQKQINSSFNIPNEQHRKSFQEEINKVSNENDKNSLEFSPELIQLRTLSCGSDISNSDKGNDKQQQGKQSKNIRTNNTKNNNVFGFEDTSISDDFNYISSKSIVPVKITKKQHKMKTEKRKNQMTNKSELKQYEQPPQLLVKSNSQKSPLKGIISTRKDDNNQEITSQKTVRIKKEKSITYLRQSIEQSTDKRPQLASSLDKKLIQSSLVVSNDKRQSKKKSFDRLSIDKNSDQELSQTQLSQLPQATAKKQSDKQSIKKTKSLVDSFHMQQQQQLSESSSFSPSIRFQDGNTPRNKQKTNENKRATTQRQISACDDNEKQQFSDRFNEKLFKNLLKEEHNNNINSEQNFLQYHERSSAIGSTAKSGQIKRSGDTPNNQSNRTKKGSILQPRSSELIPMNPNLDKLNNNFVTSNTVGGFSNMHVSGESKKKSTKDRIKDLNNSYRRDSADSVHSNTSSHKTFTAMHQKKSGFAKAHREQSLRNVNIGINNNNNNSQQSQQQLHNTSHRHSIASQNSAHHFKSPIPCINCGGSPITTPDSTKLNIDIHEQKKGNNWNRQNSQNLLQSTQQQQDSFNSLSNVQHSRGEMSPSSAISLRKLNHLKTPILSSSSANNNNSNNHGNLKQIHLFQHSNLPQSSFKDQSEQATNSFLNNLRKNLLKIEETDPNRRQTLKILNNQINQAINSPTIMYNNNNFHQPRPSLKPLSPDILQVQQQQLLDLLGSSRKVDMHNHHQKDENSLSSPLDPLVQTQILNLLQNNFNQQQQQQQQQQYQQQLFQQQALQNSLSPLSQQSTLLQLPQLGSQQTQQIASQTQPQSQQPQLGAGLLQPQQITSIITSQPLVQPQTQQGTCLSSVFNEYQIKEGDSIFQLMGFDEMKNFQYYFPKGNSSIVIQKVNSYIQNKITQIIKRFKKSKILGSKRQTITDNAVLLSQRKNSLISKKPTRKRSFLFNGEVQINSFSSINVPDDHSLQLAKQNERNRKNSGALNQSESQISQDSDINKVNYSAPQLKAAEALVGIGGGSISSSNNSNNNNINHNIQNAGYSPKHRKSIFNKITPNS